MGRDALAQVEAACSALLVLLGQVDDHHRVRLSIVTDCDSWRHLFHRHALVERWREDLGPSDRDLHLKPIVDLGPDRHFSLCFYSSPGFW
jgi:xanthine dehydrogenase iron-sulfur cluster and FAD-binding subunit A